MVDEGRMKIATLTKGHYPRLGEVEEDNGPCVTNQTLLDKPHNAVGGSEFEFFHFLGSRSKYGPGVLC